MRPLPEKPVNDGRLIDLYLDMLAAERGAAANTVAAYRRDLTAIGEALPKGRRLFDAGPDDLRHCLQGMVKAGLSASTQARKLSTLRGFYRFLVQDGLRSDDPAQALDSPRLSRPLPKVLTVEDVSALLQCAATKTDHKGLRLTCLLEVIYASGLRVSELLGLPHPPLGPDPRFLQVRGKGGRERLAPMSPEALEALARYLEVRPMFLVKGQPSPWLFPSRGVEGHLTRQAFGIALKQLAREAGIDPARVSPHVLRHAFASHLLAGGADLRSLQKMLGHADISTTQIYTHVQEARLAALVEQAHPLARRGRTG